MDRDLSYFSRRADEERSAARSASHAAARQAHLQMARNYEALIAAADVPAVAGSMTTA